MVRAGSQRPRGIAFGWGAAPIPEQLPMLPKDDADHFEADHKALVRLHVRGVISDKERDRAVDDVEGFGQRADATPPPDRGVTAPVSLSTDGGAGR